MQDAERLADADQGALGSATLKAFFRQLAAEDAFDLGSIFGHNDQQLRASLDLFADAAAEASDNGLCEAVYGEAATPVEAASFRVEGSSNSTDRYLQQSTSPAVIQGAALDIQVPEDDGPAFARAAANAAAPSLASGLGLAGPPELLPTPAAGMAAGLGRQLSSASTTTGGGFALQVPSILFGVSTNTPPPAESLQRFVVPATPRAAAKHGAASKGSASRARASKRSKGGALAQQAAKAAPHRESSPTAAAGDNHSTAAERSASPLVTISSSSSAISGTPMRALQRANRGSMGPAQTDAMLKPKGSGSRQQGPADTAADDACAVCATELVGAQAQPNMAPATSPFATAAAAAGSALAGIGPLLGAPRLQPPTAVPAAYAVDLQHSQDPAPSAVRVPGLQSAPSASYDLASAGLLSNRWSASTLRLPTLLPPAIVHCSESMLHSAVSAPAAEGTGLLRTANTTALRAVLTSTGRARSAQISPVSTLQDRSAAAAAETAAHLSGRLQAPALAASARAAAAPAEGPGAGAGLFAAAGQGAWAAGGAGAHASTAPLAALAFLPSTSAAPTAQDVLQPLLVPQHSLNFPASNADLLAGLAAAGAGRYAGPGSALSACGSSRKRSAAVARPVAAGGLPSTDGVDGGKCSRRRASMEGPAEAAQVGLVGAALMAQQITELTVLQAQLQRTLAGLHASWVAMQGPQQGVHGGGDAAAEQRHKQLLLQQVLQYAAGGG